MKKILSLLTALALCGAMFAGCAKKGEGDADADKKSEMKTEIAASDYEYIKGNGKMVIGYTLYKPMNYLDDSGKLVGFDTELAEAVCEKLGVKPEFVEINWDTKETELKAKSIDCIWNGFTITDERKENLEFSRPYIENKQVVVIKKSNADKYTDTKSLSGANLVAETSSAGEEAIADDENLSKASYTAVGKQTDGLLEVKAGTADAVILDYTLADAMVGEGTDFSDLCMIDGLDLCVEEYGVGFRKGSDMAQKTNETFDALTADGTMDKLAEKYGLSAIVIK